MLTSWEPPRVLLLLTLSSAMHVIVLTFKLPKFGGCPNIAAQQKLLSNIEPFLGNWYVQSSYDTEILQGKGRCMAVNYKYIPLFNAVLVKMGQFNEENNKWERLEANAYPKNVKSDEGKFTLKFTLPIWGEVSGTYTILNTDFENYSVVHGCGSVFGILHFDCSWLMSRKQRLTPEEEVEYYKKTDKVLENYDSLNPKKFKNVDQFKCEKNAI